MQTISFVIFWDLLMFYQIFVWPQVRRCVIITYKHGIYKMAHELLSDLRLRILANWEISGICLNYIEWYPSVQSHCKREIFVNTWRNLLKNRHSTFPSVRYFTRNLALVSDILWVIVSGKTFFHSNSAQNPSNLISLTY